VRFRDGVSGGGPEQGRSPASRGNLRLRLLTPPFLHDVWHVLFGGAGCLPARPRACTGLPPRYRFNGQRYLQCAAAFWRCASSITGSTSERSWPGRPASSDGSRRAGRRYNAPLRTQTLTVCFLCLPTLVAQSPLEHDGPVSETEPSGGTAGDRRSPSADATRENTTSAQHFSARQYITSPRSLPPTKGPSAILLPRASPPEHNSPHVALADGATESPEWRAARPGGCGQGSLISAIIGTYFAGRPLRRRTAAESKGKAPHTGGRRPSFGNDE